MKIAFFEIEEWEKDYIQKKLPNHELIFNTKPITEANVDSVKDAEVLAVFIYSKVNKELLEKLPNLKYVTTMSTGFDHVDIETCKAKNIKASNVPFYGENTVAEHTFALILALSRKIPESIERVNDGEFNCDGLRGFDLKGKTIGVVGGGHIGMHVVRMAKGFEMNVLVFDIRKDDDLARELGFEYVEMNELLERSDIVSLHAPYNTHTHHLLNKDNIRKMKKGAYLINTARGGLVETDAMYKALVDEHLAGAALDVLEEESEVKEEKQLLSKEFHKEVDVKTILENHQLIKMPNVLITPHNAFNSEEALLRIVDTTVDNIKAFVEGKIENNVIKD